MEQKTTKEIVVISSAMRMLQMQEAIISANQSKHTFQPAMDIYPKLDKLGMRPALMIIDDFCRNPSKRQLRKIALTYKGKYNMRDNNCKANHERGLQNRIANYATQHTLRTMHNSPIKVAHAMKVRFYTKWMKVLGLRA